MSNLDGIAGSSMLLCVSTLLGALVTGELAAQTAQPGPSVKGEQLPASKIGRGVVEDMATVLARDLERRKQGLIRNRERGDAQGEWQVPSRGATFNVHSGRHNIVNQWGDTRMGIGFPTPSDVHGVYVAAQAAPGVWTAGLRAVGYRDGEIVGITDWFEDIDRHPDFLAIDFENVDRVVFEARPVINGAGWYALDDLAFTPRSADPAAPSPRVVLGFDDLNYRHTLTGSGYGGLKWEVGTGDFDVESMPGPQSMPTDETPLAAADALAPSGAGGATPPILSSDFQGVVRGDAGVAFIPPDTHGAIGPAHFVVAVNSNFAVYDRFTGLELINVSLGSFHPGSFGDPRAIYDQHSGRFIVINSDFNTEIFLAISLTSDPTGAWFKTQFTASAGTDAGCFPDYPPLGVDANGIYTSALMAGGCGTTIFAIDKAPLLTGTPALGTVTAFRGLPFEGAHQPVHTYGNPGVQYFVSRGGANTLRLRQVSGPLTSPTLTDLGLIVIPINMSAPDAPALGSTTPVSTINTRPLGAVYRDGSIWTTQDVRTSFGTAGCRWYEFDVATTNLIQFGTIEDPLRHYYFGSIMVNIDGDAVMGFSGSSATEFIGAYYTGRRSTDPPGTMATPVLFRPGVESYTVLDLSGRNRWGDYTNTTLDPLNERTFFTIQEYTHTTNTWGTQIAELSFCEFPPTNDCNGNCIEDSLDIADAASSDCNANGVPDECDIASLASLDCNANSTPDECEDCNLNGLADECELVSIFIEDTGEKTPFGFGFDAVHLWSNPPPAIGEVTFTFHAIGTLQSTANKVDVFFSTEPVPQFSVFVTGASDCAPGGDIDTFVMDAATFNSKIDRNAIGITMRTFDFLSTDCGGLTAIQLEVSYTADLMLDTNNNGLLDVCECAEDCAGAPDGNVGIDEFLAVLANWGTAVSCDFAPPGGDGTIGIEEFLGVLANWGPCFTP